MLRLDFINVGDGDAILVREYRNMEAIYTLLIDCGRQEVQPFPGSKRQTSAHYLRQQGIRTIDLLVITHMHLDHFGGIPLLQNIRVKRMLSNYLPGQDTAHITHRSSSINSPSVTGLYGALESFIQSVRILEGLGCTCERALNNIIPFFLTKRLKMRVNLPDGDLLQRQTAAFSDIEKGEQLAEERLFPVSKERNNASLRISLEYAGRRILLPGDAYGEYWQSAPDAIPCDILKVPHHGDEKSLTISLIRRLRPSCAVITGLMGDGSKHRPAEATLALLRRYAGRFVCLENNALNKRDAASHEAVILTVRDSGKIRQRTLG